MAIDVSNQNDDLVKVVVDVDPVPTDFERWAKPGHFSRSLSKGPLTTTWIWNLHADVHDFDAWLSNPAKIKPSAQVVWPIVGQDILNGDVGD
eukprot:8064214-Prorocentrum_lima.AAC.1